VKILVICSNLIGDNVLSSGVFDYLFKKHQTAKFTLVIGPTAEPLFKNFKPIERIITIKKKKFNFHWLEIYRQCSKTKWDIIVDFRSSLLSFFLKHNKKYIFKKNNHSHHVIQLSNFFEFDCSNLKIITSDDENLEAEKHINNKYRYVVIFPGGNWKPKIWPVENYNALIKKICLNNNKIKYVLVGSNLEKNLYYKKLVNGIDKKFIIDLFGASLTLTCAYMKKSNLFVGNDSGLMHLAAACNLKTIALFGPTNDEVYSPWGKKNIVIRTKENYYHFKSKKLNRNNSYMNSISIDDIFNKIGELGFYDK
tara:strand:+ start:5684 stop:6610 length:927 start_codon:yes stop_codon:yes gene_type:complete